MFLLKFQNKFKVNFHLSEWCKKVHNNLRHSKTKNNHLTCCILLNINQVQQQVIKI